MTEVVKLMRADGGFEYVEGDEFADVPIGDYDFYTDWQLTRAPGPDGFRDQMWCLCAAEGPDTLDGAIDCVAVPIYWVTGEECTDEPAIYRLNSMGSLLWPNISNPRGSVQRDGIDFYRPLDMIASRLRPRALSFWAEVVIAKGTTSVKWGRLAAAMQKRGLPIHTEVRNVFATPGRVPAYTPPTDKELPIRD